LSAIGIAIEVLVAVLVVLGTVIMLISSFGILRLPDVYTRAHAATKSSTLGLLCILGGTFIHFLHTHQLVSIRLLLVIFFVFLTAPVAGHMIIRAAHRASVPLASISSRDALTEDFGHPVDAASGIPSDAVPELPDKRPDGQ
jgi:multicomponent Na+:H+ antiporter subunit G